MALIYALVDPVSSQARYVGKTSRSLASRLHQHTSNGGKSHKANWIRGLRAKGHRPEIVLLEEVEEQDWPDAERFWIAYFKWAGANLCNHSIGGESGALGYRKYRTQTDHLTHRWKLTTAQKTLLIRASQAEGLSLAEYIRKSAFERAGIQQRGER